MGVIAIMGVTQDGIDQEIVIRFRLSVTVQDRGSDMAGLFAVRREAFAATACGGDGVGSDG
eukprot:scaffold14443_cov107-Amphora_coffeaeformis.AAC.1